MSKELKWDQGKNNWLKKVRGVSFEMVREELTAGRLVATFINKRGQICLVVRLNGYPHVVPIVEDDLEIWLKTIFPNRRFK